MLIQNLLRMAGPKLSGWPGRDYSEYPANRMTSYLLREV